MKLFPRSSTTPIWQLYRYALPLLLFTAASFTSAKETDDESGLIKAEGWTVVKSTCTVCHAGMMITQNAGNLAVWKSRILWMQETQGLRTLTDEEEAVILNYLSVNYPQKASSRRAGLPARLLPANPAEASD